MHRTWVEISLDRLAANYRAIRTAVGDRVAIAPVVKADAYRHGAVEVSRRLEAEGASWLSVSNAQEGVELREAGIAARILVMGDFLAFEREAFYEHGLTPVIHSLDALRLLDKPIAYHLKLDTGMGRLGTRAGIAEVVDAVLRAPHLQLEGLMTHFASADIDAQLAAFEAARAALRQAGIDPPWIHLSASAPIAMRRGDAHGTLVRPGLSLYGYGASVAVERPFEGPRLAVEPPLTWKARILEIKDLPAGAPVGYGPRWRAARPTRMAVVAAGYADGVPHRLSNCGQVIAAGKLAPIIGAVSMDLITVDVTDCPPPKRGDTVTLLGREGDVKYDAEDIARDAGIISYAVLCGLGNRVRRVYV